MTIRRPYSLPNCTLVLEGLSDGSAAVGNQVDPRPLMTILVHAECHFTGTNQPLSGGREFFESLVKSVSRYAQEWLSHVHYPKLHGDPPAIVQLHSVQDKNLHRLTVLPKAESVPSGSGAGTASAASYSLTDASKLIQIDLTTVQLFDLVEAIDQFLADRRTLPDLNVSLEPLSRRYRKADQPLAKRAAPAALGATGLAVAAIAFFVAPIPQVGDSKPLTSQPNSSETNPGNGENQATGTPRPTPPSTSELESILTSAPELSDPTQLAFLQRNLYNKLNQAWDDRGQVDQNLEYQVGVGKDGAIVGYRPVDETPIDAATKTPLPELLYIPATGSIATNEAIAQYRVVFNQKGILQISPWRGYTGKPSLGPEITDAAVLKELNDKLYQQIRDKWEGTPTYQRNLVYRVAVTEEGVIADYEPNNQPAWDYVQQTPLESLFKPEAAGIGNENTELLPQKPLAQFRVVFKPSGVLEVSPLRGYR